VTVDLAAAAEDYRRDGAVVLRGLFDADLLAVLARGVDRNLAEPGPLCIATGEPGRGRFVEDFRNWDRIPEYEAFVRASPLGAVAAALTGSAEVRLFHDHLLVKEAGTPTPTPLHQDQPYYCIDGRRNVSFWVPLDPVPRESTLELVAGSHAAGTWYLPRSFVEGTAMVFDEGTLVEVPDVAADPDRFPIVGWAVEPGDAVAFHMLTLHRAAGSAALRRVFGVRCIGDDVTYAPRPHRTSPPYPELEGALAPGAPLADDRLFPVLWPAP
jgi:ectoine hydroxylase-related dioxygenase (phytanoyl-CoA dioxygenase family)